MICFRHWDDECTKQDPSLQRCLWRFVRKDIIQMVLISVFYVRNICSNITKTISSMNIISRCCNIKSYHLQATSLTAQPPLYGYVVNYFMEKSSVDQTEAIWKACIAVILAFVFCISNRYLFFNTMQLGTKLRIAFTGITFEKVCA